MITLKKKLLFITTFIIYVPILYQTLQGVQNVALSYCIADLKFDGKCLKICELGPCSTSAFKGHETLFGPGKVWESIWEHARSFGLPLWFIGEKISNRDRQEFALDYFENLGGIIIKKLDQLDGYLQTKQFKKPTNVHDIMQYEGIVFIINKFNRINQNAIDQFKNNNPSIILVDSTTKEITSHKAHTNKLFAQAHLDDIKAPWLLKKKKYSHTLAQEIITELNYPIYVIKPIASSKGKGVIITSQEDLANNLQIILTHGNKFKINTSESHRYWAFNTDDEFLVEAFIPSKPIAANRYHFDGTMRVVFAMTYHNQHSFVDPLTSYWKLPKKHLKETGSLNALHKSNISSDANRTSSAIVKQHDAIKVYDILQERLPLFCDEIMKNNKK